MKECGTYRNGVAGRVDVLRQPEEVELRCVGAGHRQAEDEREPTKQRSMSKQVNNRMWVL